MPICFQDGNSGSKVTTSFWRTPTLGANCQCEGIDVGRGYLRKSADCVIGVNAASILVVHRHTGIAIANIGHNGIE